MPGTKRPCWVTEESKSDDPDPLEIEEVGFEDLGVASGRSDDLSTFSKECVTSSGRFGASVATIGLPQCEQNFAPSTIVFWQLRQFGIARLDR
ncbi:MAG: hypothetical protein VX988_02215 [Planctomycetota bacterium]|nr:hypothetical protein [Planctomycetota bacterium]